LLSVACRDFLDQLMETLARVADVQLVHGAPDASTRVGS
jgi:hypothetical protein